MDSIATVSISHCFSQSARTPRSPVKAPNRRTSCPSESRPGGTATQCSSDPMSMPAALRLIRLSCGGSGTLGFDTLRTLGRRLARVGVVLTGASPLTTWIDAAGAEVRALHSPKRDHVADTRVTNDVGAFLRNQANGRAQAPMKARFPRPTASRPFYSKPHVTPSYFLLFSCEAA